jgi:hypothetical protein
MFLLARARRRQPGEDRVKRTLLIVAALLAARCGGDSPSGPSRNGTETSFAQHTSAHFTFHHTATDAATIATTALTVEAEFARITADLQVSAMPQVAVYLHPDLPSMQAAVRPFVGSLPAGATGLVTAVDRIHVLSPTLAREWSYEDGRRAIVHEFAHCVTWRVNPTIGNNPRWLWESVAVYEAMQFVHPRRVHAFTAAQPPTLARLNAFDNTDVYDVGYVIGEFIVSRWGRDGLVSLIRSNGNLAQTTGLTEAGFVAQWAAFVQRAYGV